MLSSGGRCPLLSGSWAPCISLHVSKQCLHCHCRLPTGILQPVCPGKTGPRHSFPWNTQCPANTRLAAIHPHSICVHWAKGTSSGGPGEGPAPAPVKACPQQRTASGCSRDEAGSSACFPVLVITSLFSGNLMFSVTCTFSHWDLALVLRKQWFFLDFFFFFPSLKNVAAGKLSPCVVRRKESVAAVLAGSILLCSFCHLHAVITVPVWLRPNLAHSSAVVTHAWFSHPRRWDCFHPHTGSPNISRLPVKGPGHLSSSAYLLSGSCLVLFCFACLVLNTLKVKWWFLEVPGYKRLSPSYTREGRETHWQSHALCTRCHVCVYRFFFFFHFILATILQGRWYFNFNFDWRGNWIPDRLSALPKVTHN